MIKNSLKLAIALILFSACKEEKKMISKKAQEVRDYVKKDVVIAHRGTTYWAPEETEPAFLWARNIGADYIEFDIQQTKDGKLVAFHDNDLTRISNVKSVFPEREKSPINEFTLKELRSLDVGTWFNKKYPERARDSYEGLIIMSLRDAVMIAEGNRVAKKNGQPIKEIVNGEWTGQYMHEQDPNDNKNRPGIYIETKRPTPNVEKLLADELTSLGWNINKNAKVIKTYSNKVNIGNTKGRLIFQSFSLESNILLDKYFPNIPKCLLLWHPKMIDDINGKMAQAIDFCIENNIHSMGTSVPGEPNNYGELTNLELSKMIHDAGMIIHPYTFDTKEQLTIYKDRIEGVFTNKTDLALEIYNRKSNRTAQEVLEDLEY